jgi:ACT domain-containing protein|tara:strand:- start:427 stop:657 length:231 start_codon:yes stop_codon:yes gene_type:complete
MTEATQSINYARILDDCLAREPSIQSLCDKTGISRSSFYRFRSERKINATVLEKLIKKYNLDIAYYIEYAPDFEGS